MMQRNTATVLVLYLILLGGSATAKADTPIFKVDKRTYTLEELTGQSLEEFDRQFNNDVRTLTDEQLRETLQIYTKRSQNRAAAIIDLTSRQQLEQLLFRFAYEDLLDFLARRMVLAHICQEIVDRHAINLSVYFDMEYAKDAWRRQITFTDELSALLTSPDPDIDAFYERSKEKYQLKWSRSDVDMAMALFRNQRAFQRWSSLAARRFGTAADSYGLRAMCAQLLLKDACENGIYARMATDRVQQLRSSFLIVDVHGYRGRPEILTSVVEGIIDKDGDVALGGLHLLRRWLEEQSLGATIEATVKLGGTIGEPLSDSVEVGRLTWVRPGLYRIVGWQNKISPEKGAKEAAVLQVFNKVFSYSLGVQSYLPKFESYVPDWDYTDQRAMEAVAAPGTSLAVADVAVDGFVRKEYSGDIFAEFEEHGGALDEFIVRAAQAESTSDRVAGQKLADEITEYSRTPKQDVVANRFRLLTDRVQSIGQVDVK